MLTYKIYKTYDDGSVYVEGDCLSGDTKPVNGIANGSLLMEMDTAKLYKFDATGKVWRAWE